MFLFFLHFRHSHTLAARLFWLQERSEGGWSMQGQKIGQPEQGAGWLEGELPGNGGSCAGLTLIILMSLIHISNPRALELLVREIARTQTFSSEAPAKTSLHTQTYLILRTDLIRNQYWGVCRSLCLEAEPHQSPLGSSWVLLGRGYN